MMPVIEFVGVPGSGKTTIADAVADRLRSAGFTVYDRCALDARVRQRYVGPTTVGTILRLIPYVVRHPSFGRRACAALLRAEARRRLARRLSTAINRLRIRTTLTAAQAIGVPDEWVIHELSLAAIEAGPRAMPALRTVTEELVRRLPGNTLTVECRTDVDTAARRVSTRRGTSDYDGMPAHVLVDRFKASACANDLILAELRRMGREVLTCNVLDGSSAARIAAAAAARAAGIDNAENRL